MAISTDQLERMRNAFGVSPIDDQSILVDRCFEEAYKACQNKQWELIESFRDELTILTNSVGHTLLIRALIRKEDGVITGLCEREIAILTPDPCGHYPMGYISAGQSEEQGRAYSELLLRHGAQRQEGIIDDEVILKAKLGPMLFHQGQYEEAISLTLELLNWYKEHWGESLPEVADSLFNLGSLYDKVHKPIEAVAHYEEALTLYRKYYGDIHDKVAQSLKRVADLYAFLGIHCDRCKAYYEEAISVSREVHGENDQEEAFLSHRLASLCKKTGKFPEAIAYYDRAIAVLETIEKFRPWDVIPTMLLGLTLSRREEVSDHIANYQFAKAECLYKLGRQGEALDLACRTFEERREFHRGNDRYFLPLLCEYGDFLLAVNEYKKAEEIYLQAVQLVPRESIELWYKLGLVYLALNERDKAEGFFVKVIEPSSYLTDERLKAFNQLGTIYMHKGQFEKAEEAFLTSIRLIKEHKGSDHPDVYTSLSNLANLYTMWGSKDKARECATEVLAYRKKMFGDDHASLVAPITALANLHMDTEAKSDKDLAKEHYLQALDIAKRDGDFSRQAQILKNLGSHCLRLNQLEEARNYYDNALIAHQNCDDLEGLAELLLDYGVLFADLGDFTQAMQFQLTAVHQLNDIRSIKVGNAYVAFGITCMRQKNYEQAEKALRYAVDFYEARQKETLSDEWKILVMDGYFNAYRTLEILFLSQQTEEKGKLALEICDRRKARSLVSILRSRSSSIFVPLTPLRFQEMVKVAKQNEALLITLSYTDQGDGGMIIWMISPSGTIVDMRTSYEGLKTTSTSMMDAGSFPFKSGDFASNTDELIAQFEESHKSSRDLTPQQMQRLSELRENFKADLRSWYQALIKPIETYLAKEKGQKLVFIPDQELATVPFSLLLDESGTFLFERYSIYSAPSIMTLEILRHMRPHVRGAQRALIIDDPLSGSGSLKTGGEESKRLAGLMGTSTILHGEEATPSRVLEEMQRADWVHFSCHGSNGHSSDRSDKHSPYRGHLCLFQDKAHREGHLLTEEIANTRMRADLVVMSACSTGIGTLKKDGLIGLVRSFLAAGASSVLASHWRVSDSEITVQMMERFYQCLTKQEPMSKAEALREAMLLSKQIDPEAIEKWGVFFLAGLDTKIDRKGRVERIWSAVSSIFRGLYNVASSFSRFG